MRVRLHRRFVYSGIAIVATLSLLTLLIGLRTSRPGGTVTAQQAPSAPGASASVTAQGPDFSNRVLHWQNRSYSADDGSPDPKNQAWAVSDVWVKVGSNNRPVAERGVTTVSGQFNQAVLYDFVGWEMTSFGFAVAPPVASAGPPAVQGVPAAPPTLQAVGSPGGTRATLPAPVVTAPAGTSPATPGCTAAQPISLHAQPALLANALPPYVDPSKLQAAGYQRSSQQPPSPPNLDRNLQPAGTTAAPTSVLGVGNIMTWAPPPRPQGPPNGGTLTGLLAFDSATGRQVAWESFRQSPTGSPVLAYAELSSPVEVFSASDIPTSLFSAQSLQGGCHA